MSNIKYSVQVSGDKTLFKTLDNLKIKYTTLLFDGFNFLVLEVGIFDSLNDAIQLKKKLINDFDVEIVKYINGLKDENFNENGFKPNKEDLRDFIFGNHDWMNDHDNDLYNKDYDLRNEFMPDVFDQIGGSCTAQATVASYWYQMNILYNKLGTLNTTQYSRAFTYLMTRYLHEGIMFEGGCIRNACKSIKKYGVADERHFPSDNGDLDRLPDFYTMAYAANDKIDSYYAISEKDDYLLQILTCLDNNIPVIVSMNSDMFRDARNDGISEKSLDWDERIESNHALLVVGRLRDFDYLGEKKNVIVIRNSWGEDWGDKGYFYIPEDQFVKYGLCDAMIIIKDDFGCDEPEKEFIVPKHGKKNAIPNNTLIYNDRAYSLKYLYKLRETNNDKFHKIYDPILKDIENAYTKKDNKITDIEGNENAQIGFPLIYTGNDGEIYLIK